MNPRLRQDPSGPSRVATALLALALAATPARAVIVAEFGTRCADGDAAGSFIELIGSPGESTRILTGLRALDHTGAVMFDMADVYGPNGAVYYSWLDGRRFLLLTQGGKDRLLRENPGFAFVPDNILAGTLDPAGGRLVLYRVSNGSEIILDQVSYGPGGVFAPPPGTSMERAGLSWQFRATPSYNFYFDVSHVGVTDSCLGFERFYSAELALACEDGGTRGQYVELRASGPNVQLDSRLHVRVFDHRDTLLTDVADPFGERRDTPVADGTPWLLGGPAFTPGDTSDADARLPVELDPVGGTIELSGTFYGTPILFDRFKYGTLAVPAPAPGTAYARVAGGLPRVVPPAPVNSFLQRVSLPLCALGSNPPRYLFGELALACASGSTTGQFVEITGSSDTGLPLGSGVRLRAFARDGLQRFELADVFARVLGARLTRSRSFLLTLPASPVAGLADALLPDTLDRVAGRLELVGTSGLTGADTLLASLAWGDPPLQRPGNGSSLVTTLTGTRSQAYPTPVDLGTASAVVPGCHLQSVPRTLRVDEVGMACADGSFEAAFLELGALDPDPTLGLSLATSGGDELARVFPLYPARDGWGLTGGEHWLVGGPAFEARSGVAPDAVFSPALTRLPTLVRLFRRDPVTGAESVLGSLTLPLATLTPGHVAVRRGDGSYGAAAIPTPQRFDGTIAVPADCWAFPHPEQVVIHSLLLRCRDDDVAGQAIELEPTSPDASCSPELSVRLYDRADRLLGERAQLFPQALSGTVWPAGTRLLLGASGFQARLGIAPDALLPATLDTLAGRVQLALVSPGAGEVVLDEVRYGTPELPVPAAGASLRRSGSVFVADPLPSLSGFSASVAAPNLCLGECPPRTAQFSLGGPQVLAGAEDSLAAPGVSLTYETAPGTFRLDAGGSVLAVAWSDRFKVEGLADGTPLAFEARLRNVLTSRDTCIRICYTSVASAVLVSADGSDSSAAARLTRRTLAVPVRAPAGAWFPLDLRLRANAVASPQLAASVHARIEFAGLPDGARVVSCHGFDSRTQRSFGTPSVQAEPRAVTVRWPATGPAGFSALVERRVDDDDWVALETRPVDADGTLLVVDRRAEPGHAYRYRVSWSDELGSYTSPEAVATTPRSPGFDFAGVRPNPSSGEFAASLELPEASEVRFEVLDVAGRVVASHARWLDAGAHVVPLTERSALPPGLYMVRLRYRGLEFRRSVIVLR